MLTTESAVAAIRTRATSAPTPSPSIGAINSAGGERDDREHGDVEGDALERPVLRRLDHARGHEQQQGAGRPAVEDDRRDGEHERQGHDAAAALDVDRDGEALRERRCGGESDEAEELAAAVRRGREDVRRRDRALRSPPHRPEG